MVGFECGDFVYAVWVLEGVEEGFDGVVGGVYGFDDGGCVALVGDVWCGVRCLCGVFVFLSFEGVLGEVLIPVVGFWVVDVGLGGEGLLGLAAVVFVVAEEVIVGAVGAVGAVVLGDAV